MRGGDGWEEGSRLWKELYSDVCVAVDLFRVLAHDCETDGREKPVPKRETRHVIRRFRIQMLGNVDVVYWHIVCRVVIICHLAQWVLA